MSTVPASVRSATSSTSEMLRRALRIDAWGTAAFGVVLLAGAMLLVVPFGLPVHWSIPFGIAMLGGAGCLGLIAGYPRIPTKFAVFVITGNALSVVALVALAFSNLIPLTGFGIIFFLSGAVIVAVLAIVESIGLRLNRE